MFLLGQTFECCVLMGLTGPDLAEQRVLTHFLPSIRTTPASNEQRSQALLNLLTEGSALRRLSLCTQMSLLHRCSKANTLCYLPLHECLSEAPNSVTALPLWRDILPLAAHTPGCSVHDELFSFWFFFFSFAGILLWPLDSARESAETNVLSVHYNKATESYKGSQAPRTAFSWSDD